MANRTWIGNAGALYEKYTQVIGGTWLAGDLMAYTIGTKTITITLGSTVTTTQIATEIASAWNGTPALGTAYSVTQTGNLVPEFNEITATISGSTLTFTHDTIGQTFAMSRAITSASGTGSLTNTVDGTGVNDVANTANFSEASALANTNDFYLDRPVSLLLGLAQSAVTLNSWTVGERFTSAAYVGLPFRRSTGYEEYRTTYFAIGCTTFNYYGTSGLFKWDAGSVQTAATLWTGGTSADTGRSAFQFIGTHASNTMTIFGGDVGIAANTGEVATVATLKQTGGTVNCGPGATLTTVTKTNGTLTVNSSTTTLLSQDGTTNIKGGTHTALTVGGGTCNVTGSSVLTTLRIQDGTVSTGVNVTATTIDKSTGTLTINHGCTTLTSDSGDTTANSGSFTTVNINGGTFYYGGTGTIATLNANNCGLGFDHLTNAGCTVTTINLTGNLTIIDTAKRVTWTNGLPLINGTIKFIQG